MLSWTWTALVKSKQSSGKSSFGTGFAVKRGWLLTAKHVLETDLNARDVRVFWQHSQQEGYRSDDEQDGLIKVEKIIDHPELDASLIKCAMPDDIDLLPFLKVAHSSGRFETEGYPTGAMYQDKPTRLRVGGLAFSTDGSEPKVQVTLDPDPDRLEDWRGLSGGPVVLDSLGQAVGIFKDTRQVLGQARTAWAVPIHALLSYDEFRNVLCDETWREAEPEEVDAHRVLARQLVFEATCALSPSDLAAVFNIEQAEAERALNDETHLCRTYCDRLLTGRSKEAWAKIRAVHRDLEDEERKRKLLDLSTLVAAYSLDDRALSQVLFVRRDRDAPDRFVVAEAAHTMIGVELVASSVDALSPEFAPGEDPSMSPYGAFAMPFVTPEAGPGGADAHKDVLANLQSETGLSAISSSSLISEVDSFLANGKKLSPAELASGDELNARASKRLSQLLRRYRDDKKRSFYLTVVWPEDETLRENLRSELQELKTRYPSLLILGLGADDDASIDEEGHYGALISTIKDD